VRIGLRRFFGWQRDLAKRQAERAQDRTLADGLDEGCVFCGSAPWDWAYPMNRVGREPAGGEFLFPAYLPVCNRCHVDIESGRADELIARLHEANKGRRYRKMRELVPIFLGARNGAAVARADAPELVRTEGRGRG
jgi:hypothetical protein